ncbi:50S ribosomal protein L35 [Candidatus Saccharibacteria bacterium]|jgi:ribosomal protein L35|nr:50S ribosomal protein L35 [Candidatus Saccharibacteria bacterium]HOR23309.1 bL35 family ribosomal protein [Candidatus Saccharibacteria bacterium]HPW47918.1 bL35 family ribosomal protein [Candidatus Saccharibacteria bacterium]
MPKAKSHSGVKDRVKISKNGKVLARKSYGNHFLEKKSMARKRTFSGYKSISGKLTKIIRRKVAS